MSAVRPGKAGSFRKGGAAGVTDGAGTKKSTDAHNASLPSGAAHRGGMEPLLRVRSFGSVVSQAMKKVRRPEGV